jgi:hypothetical protein
LEGEIMTRKRIVVSACCLLATALVVCVVKAVSAQGVYVAVPYGVYSPVYGPAPGIYAYRYAPYPYPYNPRRAYRQAVRAGAVAVAVSAWPPVVAAYPTPAYVYRPTVVRPVAPAPAPAIVATPQTVPAPPAPAQSSESQPELLPTPDNEPVN